MINIDVARNCPTNFEGKKRKSGCNMENFKRLHHKQQKMSIMLERKTKVYFT